ncbi:MAG: peptidase M50 [Bacteroidetes bacterium]|nr:MAG: peptidase M50 [Bacteroidota bacterium]
MPVNETSMIESTDQGIYPPKPLVQDRESNPYVSAIISLLLYAAFGYMLGGGSVVTMVALVIVLLIHESGHLAAMWFYGYQKLRMLFIPLMGAVAMGNKQDVSDKEDSVILLAGPLPGILLGYVLLFLSVGSIGDGIPFFTNDGSVSTEHFSITDPLMYGIARLFIILNVINLLPFFPLDGGQLFRALFFRTGFVPYFIFAVVSLGFLLLIFSGNLTTVVLLVVFFGRPLYNQYRAQAFYKALKQQHVDYRKTYDELSDRDFWLMRDALPAYSNSYNYIVPDQFRIFPNANAMEIQAIRSLLERRYHQDLGAAGKIFFSALWLLSLLSVFVTDYILPGSIGILERLGL